MHNHRAEPALLRHQWIVLLAVIVGAFLIRNLPWNLDDYDQAKQAFVSFEMVEDGQWWFQHTPSGHIATKPPLAGWISASLYFLFGKNGWEVAWRLPSFAAALILLALVWRCGRELAGPRGALLAAAAFGFNLVAPRLATLVRTDMLLALLIFFAGWLVFEKVRRAEPWTSRDRLWLSLAVLGSLLTKGPILYAFLLPGLAAYFLLTRRRGAANHAWAGWMPWFAPLAAFAIWAGVGICLSREFYQQVVLTEFFGRFDMSDAPVHKHQPLWFYFIHIFHKWAPWSLALVALACDRRLRARLRTEPALLWLACWAIGGLVFMSLVPSKRVDRIFPIIPPLCLLLAALAEHWLTFRPTRDARIAVALIWIGALVSTGYAINRSVVAFHEDRRGLLRFGQEVREMVRAAPERFAVVNADDEGLLLYTGRTRFSSVEQAVLAWQQGSLDRLVIGGRDLREQEVKLAPFTRRLEIARSQAMHDHYFLIERGPAKTEAAHAP
jgi:4-amino-4-deoxy-L-arabinose transferase-like glycosyltransferase